jgi:hypothetical protein
MRILKLIDLKKLECDETYNCLRNIDTTFDDSSEAVKVFRREDSTVEYDTLWQR